jgi:predicted ATPase/class 3 adenylate cyclase
MTFLFTDVEGSTRLFERHPVEMHDVMAQHDESVRQVVERCAGQVVKFTGDGVLAVFAGAADAVDAAVELQVEFGRRDWPAGIVPSLRVGLHTGEAVQRAGDYFGPEVNRAARIMSVAHGGQVVCSTATAELVREKMELIDLGVHSLRGVQSPMRLWQVAASGLRRVFPPLRSVDFRASNLPAELSSFVGREDEVLQVRTLVAESRLVTVIGVGGVGKTRLAVQAACELMPVYPDGVWFSGLAAARSRDGVLEAVASALRYVPPQGTSVSDGLARFLEHKTLLLVLDNCEHLVQSVAAFVTDILSTASGVAVLATSREGLRVAGERVYTLGSLRLPDDDDPEAILASEAGRLFFLRAQAAGGGFTVNSENATAIRALCSRLDGIPLALELAAARTIAMSPDEIVQRLDRQFRLLAAGTRTGPERHQTLRAAIDWSYDLLTEPVRRLLQRCGVFVGGFDLAAATALGASLGLDELDVLDGLESLVQKSLVERSEQGLGTRYRLLEMIRQYVIEELEQSGDGTIARDLHAEHYTGLAVMQFERALGPVAWDALKDLERDIPNVGAAGRWLLDSRQTSELLQLYADLPFIDPTSLPVAVIEVLGRLAAEALNDGSAPSLPGFGQACYMAGMHHWVDGDTVEYLRFADFNAAEGEEPSPRHLLLRATVALFDGSVDTAIKLSARAVDIARRAPRPEELIFALGTLGVAEGIAASESVEATVSEAVSLARATGSMITLVFPLAALNSAMFNTKRERALAAAEECIAVDRSDRRTFSTLCRGFLARGRLDAGDVVAGLRELRAVVERLARDGDRYALAAQIGYLGDTVAHFSPAVALQIGAIAASGAIATVQTVRFNPVLARLAEEHPDLVENARVTAAAMSYTDATTYVLAAIDQLIADRSSSE